MTRARFTPAHKHLMKKFSDLGLSEQLQRAVHDAGYTTPTPIQEQAIPHLLAGHDLLTSMRRRPYK